jgi:alkylation response protein AidB-like acyl-CoA dehydrogenase
VAEITKGELTMDFELTQDQQRIRAQVEELLPKRRPLPSTSKRTVDRELFEKLRTRGLLGLARTGGPSGVLDTSLVIEQLSKAACIVPFATQALILPLLFDQDGADIAAVKDLASEGPYRFAGDANILIVFEGETARAYQIDPAESAHVRTNYVYPLAIPGPTRGRALASAPSAAVRRRQRIGIAAECVGAMDATLAQLVDYLSEREAFGRKLGSFQALHHRMSELSVLLESARWLSREAAWLDDDESSALAAAYGTKAARRFSWEAHQLCGARGFGIEFGLYEHTLRLQALSIEAGSIQAHADEAARIAWRSDEKQVTAVTPTP